LKNIKEILSFDFLSKNDVLLFIEKNIEYYPIEFYLLYEEDFYHDNYGDLFKETTSNILEKKEYDRYFRLTVDKNKKILCTYLTIFINFKTEIIIYGKQLIRYIKLQNILKNEKNNN
jgi:hypothetical protein